MNRRLGIRVTGVGAVIVLTTGCAWLERASVPSAPTTAQANAPSHRPSVSSQGRFVAFDSGASNLVPGDTNGVADVFVRDNVAKTTERVSVTSAGAQVTDASIRPSISDDGRFVAFESVATGLVPDGADGANSDVFLHDRTNHTTVLVSVHDDESSITDSASRAVISGDGRTVAFQTLSPRQIVDVPPLPSLPMGPWVRAVASSRTVLMPPAGPTALTVVSDYDLSDDGDRAVYTEVDVAGFTSTGFVGDTTLGTVTGHFAGATPIFPGTLTPTLVAVSGDGSRFAHLENPATADGKVATLLTGSTADPTLTDPTITLPPSRMVSLSGDGGVVGVETTIFEVPVVLVRSATDTRWTIASYTADGRRLVGTPESDMAASGRWFTFASTDGGLVANDTNGVADVFTRSVRGGAIPT